MAGTSKQLETLHPVSNDGAFAIDMEQPYSIEVEVTGTSPLLFHRWSCEAVAEGAAARKGSKAKKTDNVESYVNRNEKGQICLPGEYLRMAIIGAAKYKQDPRSPRKSAMDLYKAALVSLTELAPLNGGVKDWDYLDRRRVVIQRASITRSRPAFITGWTARIQLMCGLPEYITPEELLHVVNQAGNLIGVGDFRPSYGRFQVTAFKQLN